VPSPDQDIRIAIQTTANTAGAEQAQVSIQKLDKAAQDAADHAELQAQANARNAVGRSALATNEQVAMAEKAAVQKAAAASNAAAAEEAASIRVQRAMAAETAARAADLEKVLAMRAAEEAASSASAAASEKKLGILARRAAMMGGVSERGAQAADEGVAALTGSSLSAAAAKAGPLAAGLAVIAAALFGIKKTYEEISSVQEEAAKRGIQLETERMGVIMAATMATGKAVSGYWDAMKNGWSNTKAMVDDYLNGALKKGMADFDETNRRIFNAIHAAEIASVKNTDSVNKSLAEQERQLNRLLALREKLNGQAQNAAQREVEWAKLQGGDVALAETNALAVAMRADLSKLNGELARAQQAVIEAGTQEQQTVTNLNLQTARLGERNSSNEAEYKKLDEAAAKAGENGVLARQNLQDQLAAFGGAQKNIVDSTQLALAQKTKEYEGQTSTAAEKAMNKLYGDIKAELAKTPPQAQEAIAQIQADTSAIVQSATAKAGEVQTGIQTAADGTTTAIAGIGTTATATATATSASVAAASTQVTEALNLLSTKVITALGQVTAACISNANQIQSQQQQINNLFARVR
jgi:hypothetical protein